MDSLKCETQNQLKAIKQAILDGRLTHAQICDVLAGEIEKELQKSTEEVDIEYLTACQALMKSLYPQETVQVESHAEHNFEAILTKLQKKKYDSHKGKKLVAKSIFAAVCLMVMLLGADILFTKRQINVSYSFDQEQVIYDGKVTRPGCSEAAGADSQTDAVQELTTKNWNEVIAFLGYEPQMPTWLPDGWTLNEYYCAIFESFSVFDVTYTHQNSTEYLAYTIERYYGSEPLHGIFEQDRIGCEVVSATGQQLYVSSNTGSSLVIWHDNTNINSITGPATADDLIHMTESIGKGED